VFHPFNPATGRKAREIYLTREALFFAFDWLAGGLVGEQTPGRDRPVHEVRRPITKCKTKEINANTSSK
jgi:hypothetical protein